MVIIEDIVMMKYSKKFVPCTVLLTFNSCIPFGSDRKQKQGIELYYNYELENQTPKLEKLFVVGFTNQAPISVCQSS